MGQLRSLIAALAVSLTLGIPATVAEAAAGAGPASEPTATVAGPAPPARTLHLLLPLRFDEHGLRRFAAAVSTPGSPEYGRYATIGWLARRFGAAPQVRDRVARVLRHAGARDVWVSPTGTLVTAQMSVAAAQRTFSVRLARFRAADGRSFVAPAVRARLSDTATRLPPALRGLATGVVGLDTRPLGPAPAPQRRATAMPRARAHDTTGAPPSGYVPASGTPSGCSGGAGSGGFTPNQYLTAYGFDPLHAAGASGGGERVALIEIDGFKESDIVAFARCFGLDVPPITVFEVGSRRQLPPGGESTLDLEVLSAAAPRLDHIQVYENNGDAADVDKSFVLPLIHPGAKPPIVSASLGLCEPDMVQAFGPAGIRSSESSMQLAAATGITVLASSGDEGSADCKDQNGNVIDHLAVNYPSSSPWVTGVGGTNLQLAATNQIQGEDIWNDTTAALAAGGGGLSAIFGRPSYQRDVVSQNARVVPDVSMLADEAPGYAIYCTAVPECVSGPGASPWQQIGGTSAATPLLAGGLALIDQDLRRHERETVGFANPLLYAIGVHEAQIQAQIGAPVFNDVVAGSNDVGPYIPGGDGQPLGCCTAGPGFDAASGWGSVNVSALDQVALQALPAYGRVSLSIPRPQHPAAQFALRVRLTCSTSCSTYAFAVLTLGRHHEFTIKSARYRFAHPTSRTIPIRFSPGEERKLRAALAAHLRVEAEAFAVALDARGQVAKVTAGRAMRVIG